MHLYMCVVVYMRMQGCHGWGKPVVEADWVHLHVIEVDGFGPHCKGKLMPVAGRALVVGRRVLEQVGACLLYTSDAADE